MVPYCKNRVSKSIWGVTWHHLFKIRRFLAEKMRKSVYFSKFVAGWVRFNDILRCALSHGTTFEGDGIASGFTVLSELLTWRLCTFAIARVAPQLLPRNMI